MTAHNVMTILGGVLIVIGVGIMVYEMGKIWPQSKRRAAQDPDAPKPRLPSTGIAVMGAGVLLIALASLLGP